MGPLLVVIVAACALTPTVQIGRGFGAACRVDRHRHALDTLADITQAGDMAHETNAPGPDHQAHVRVIGPVARHRPNKVPYLRRGRFPAPASPARPRRGGRRGTLHQPPPSTP